MTQSDLISFANRWHHFVRNQLAAARLLTVSNAAHLPKLRFRSNRNLWGRKLVDGLMFDIKCDLYGE